MHKNRLLDKIPEQLRTEAKKLLDNPTKYKKLRPVSYQIIAQYLNEEDLE